jgi:hypothetical protein
MLTIIFVLSDIEDGSGSGSKSLIAIIVWQKIFFKKGCFYDKS